MVVGSNPVAVTSPSDFAPASSKEFLDIQATIECGFDNAVFQTELREALAKVKSHNYQSFEQAFLSLLNLHVPVKSKKQCANHKSYMTKALRKAIMKCSELATKYHKTKSIEDYNNYKKQRNFCSKLYKRGKTFMAIWTLKTLQIIRNFGKHSNHC